LLTEQQINHQLNEKLLKEKKRIDLNAIKKQKELSKALAKFKALNEQMVKSKYEKIAQLSRQIEKTKSLPQPAEFKAEAFTMNEALAIQIKLLRQKIAEAEPLCDIVASITDKSVNARTDFEQAEETLTDFLEWKDTDQGQASNLPKILESHKEILFMEWQSQLMKAEREVSK